jgi:hypothetical protein
MEYNQSIKQYPNVAINNIVSFKIWVKKAAGAGNTYFTFTSTAGSMNYLLPGAVGGYDWVEVDLLAAMIAAGASGTLTAIGFLRMDDFHVDYWIDDIVLLDNAIDFASETTLAALNATLAALYTKIPLDPAKESGKLTTIDATLTAIKATDGIKKIIDAVNVGTVTTLPAVTLADAENRVLPKAQGKTTITQSNTAINATVTIYTVTAGKTFYLCGVILEGMLYAPSLNDNVYFLIDGNIVINLGISTSILIDRAQAVAPFSLSVPLPFPAGTVFAVRSGIANLLASASMIGWEE